MSKEKLRQFQIEMHFDSWVNKKIKARNITEAFEKGKKLSLWDFLAKDVCWLDSEKETVTSVIDLNE